MQFIRKILDFAARCLSAAGRRIYRSEAERRIAPWFATHGDATLRLDYDLDASALVLDVGGFVGQWASDIHARSGCRVHIFEPCPEFAQPIARRFAQNERITVHPFGLARATGQAAFSVAGDRSSIYTNEQGQTIVQLVDVVEFFQNNTITRVDLMKVNIEGGEFDLLERMLETGLVERVENIQVQFHDFMPNARERMEAIQRELAKTHVLSWQYTFVWESWKKKAT